MSMLTNALRAGAEKDACEHEWKERGDFDLGGDRTEVICIKCGMPGERDERTGKVGDAKQDRPVGLERAGGMRGRPQIGVECTRCGNSRARRDGVCMSCRGRERRKYVFTDELSEELRLAYAGKTKQKIGAGLDRLERLTRWPRHVFKCEALRRGWTTETHGRQWEEWEIEFLEENLGEWTAKAVARRLRRSVESVIAKAEKLKVSRRRARGYNLAELKTVFGVGYYRVARWVERGLLGKAHRTGSEVWVTDRNVVDFLRSYSAEYDLRRVDQTWFKAVIFGAAAGRA